MAVDQATLPGVGCPDCERTPGWQTWTDDNGLKWTGRCACWTRQHVPGTTAGIPREFAAADFVNWRPRPDAAPAMTAARRLVAATTPRDLYLAGPVGTGKTRLACTIANEWNAAKRGAARFERVPRLLLALQPGHVDADPDRFRACETVPLLVLDDVGADRERASDFTRRTLLTLYEARHDAGRATVWTSNLSPSELGLAMNDPRLMSRLVGQCDRHVLGGGDRRQGERRRRS